MDRLPPRAFDRVWVPKLTVRVDGLKRSLKAGGDIAASSGNVSHINTEDAGRAKNLTETGNSSVAEVLHSSATGAKSAPVPP